MEKAKSMKKNRVVAPNSKRRENDLPQTQNGGKISPIFSSPEFGVTSKTFFIKSFGCQMNQYDSEVIRGMLQDAGYVIANDMEKAEIILFNTCSVRQHAEDRVYGVVNSLRGRKKKEPGLILGICGCMAQKEKDKLFDKLPHLDMVCGTDEIDRLPEMLKDVSDRQKVSFTVVKDMKMPGINPETLKDNTVAAYVAVMRGCDKFCSYCVVPYLRGREKSREIDEILKEVNELVKAGVKEIIFLGQNVLNYGKDIDKKVRLLNLLERTSKIKGLLRIRFLTSHPVDLTRDFLKGISKIPKVCKFLHLPIQSGSDRILKAMNRKYDISYYKDLINYARELMTDIAVSSDIIVGFPREKDEDFKETLKIVKKIGFDSLFMFKYSVRENTAASVLEDNVPEEEKAERLDRLIKIQNKISKEINKILIGKSVEVLPEKVNEKNKDELIGRTEQNKSVVFKGDKKLIGKIVKVKVEKATQATLIGKG
jgi:tRNA-2-methylthio-N6-dimethylallyladenosine synthase